MLTRKELDELNCLVSSLIRDKNQSIAHIFAAHSEDIPISARTLYNYIDQGYLTARNIDLQRKVRYGARRKKQNLKKDSSWRKGRTYDDFLAHIADNDSRIVEMDTVKGGKNSNKCLLTMFFRDSKCMLGFLLNDCSQEEVLKVFDKIEEAIGTQKFKDTFPIILTDNGSEFINPILLEKGLKEARTKVFYCDPNCSYQKGRLEKNHEFIRYITPRGESFDNRTQEEITTIINHINSVARKSLNYQTPYKLASILLDEEFISFIGLQEIHPDDVTLNKSIL